VIAGIVQFTEMAVEKTSPALYQTLGIYLPLITTNCAVLGIPLLNVQATTTSSSPCCSVSADRLALPW